MKKILLITLLMVTFEASSQAGWFSHSDNQHEQQLAEQLQQEKQREDQLQHLNNHLTVIMVVLSTGCAVTFITGIMIGSKTRRASNDN